MNQLESLLTAKNWKEADTETANVIFAIANRKSTHGYLSDEEWRVFPCQDLETINQLWINYSGGHFGFSIQKAIYQSLGVTEEYKSDLWQRFGTTLGWYGEGKTDRSLTAPRGRLPVLGRIVGTDVHDDWGDITRYYGWDATIQSSYYSEVSGWHTTYEKMSEVHHRFSSFVSKLASCNLNA